MFHLPKNIKSAIFSNAASQIGGRAFLSLARLFISVLIVRYAGVERFGEYALIVSILVLGEWLTDFGFTEIAVRNICQQPEEAETSFGVLAMIKAIQGVLVYVLVLLVFFALDYPDSIFHAGILGGVGLIFYSGAQVFRAIFRFRMQMQKDVLAEVAGVLAMIPLIWVAGMMQAPLLVFTACYALSRVVFFFYALYLGRESIPAFPKKIVSPEARKLIRDAVPLGILGLLVSLYEGLIPVFLSKLADMESVAFFSCAMRFVFPVIIILHAISHTVYPLLSSYWQKLPEKFQKVQENALNSSLLLASALFCMLYSMAEFLMGLVGPQMVEGAYVMKLLAWVVLIRTTTTVMSPLIIIPGGQMKALWVTIFTLLLKVGALFWLIPEYGLFGAGIGYIATELVGVVPVAYYSQHLSGVRINWRVPLKIILAGAVAVGSGERLEILGSWWSGIPVMVFYLIAALGLGAVTRENIHWIGEELRNKIKTSKSESS